MLIVEGLTKTFGTRRVLSDVGFTIGSGEVLGLIGPNGAGKTTVLECLAGLLPTDSGTLTYRGRPLPLDRRKEALFYVPDGILPWAQQTVEWVLGFFEKLYARAPGRVAELGAPLRLEEISLSTTGIDNNGDGINNDRPVINGSIISKSAFRGTPTSDVAAFVEKRFRLNERMSIMLRLEGFNLFNHGNFLGRGVTTYGDGPTAAPTFGQFVGGVGTATNAIPAFANIDPPRMFQIQAKFSF
jgi:energy-coupling factor transporter ATP-binding protein EcfA2